MFLSYGYDHRMNRISSLLGFLFTLGLLATVAPVGAQTYEDCGCGAWQDGNWVSNGSCSNDSSYRHARIVGTITAVNGSMVTIQQAGGVTVINDQPALNREATGRVAVGRQVVAYGYWAGGTFFATSLD